MNKFIANLFSIYLIIGCLVVVMEMPSLFPEPSNSSFLSGMSGWDAFKLAIQIAPWPEKIMMIILVLVNICLVLIGWPLVFFK